jgi:hypothetical protein
MKILPTMDCANEDTSTGSLTVLLFDHTKCAPVNGGILFAGYACLFHFCEIYRLPSFLEFSQETFMKKLVCVIAFLVFAPGCFAQLTTEQKVTDFTGFQLRLGAPADDEFLSGTFPVGNKTIGFIRIPSFEPLSEGNAVAQFQSEAVFFQQHTDGLVVDVMSNGGGDGCYVNLLAQALIPKTFQPLRLQVRATQTWIEDFEFSLIEAERRWKPSIPSQTPSNRSSKPSDRNADSRPRSMASLQPLAS